MASSRKHIPKSGSGKSGSGSGGSPPPVTPPSTSSPWFASGIVLGLVLVILLVFYSAMVFSGHEPLAGDTVTAEAHRVWADDNRAESGAVPTWYPDIFLGMPSYGSFVHAPGTPLAVIHNGLDLNRGTKYVLWFMIGAVGLYALLRRWGASQVAAFLGVMAFVFSPYMLGSLSAGHSSKLLSLSFMPVALLAVDYLLDRGGPLAIGLAAWALALQVWGNHPQLTFYFWLFLGAYVLVWFWKEGSGRRGRRALELGAVAVLALLMVSQPFLPAAHYAPESTRGAPSVLPDQAAAGTTSWAYATNWSFHPKELVSFAFPSFYGLQGQTYWGPMPFTQSTHAMGVVVLIYSLIGFLVLKGWRRWLLLGVIVAFLFIGFGRHLPILYRPFYEFVPQFNKFRIPSMIYAVVPFLAVLAMVVGLDAVGRRTASPRVERVLLVLSAVFGVTLIIGLVGRGGAPPTAESVWFQREVERAGGGVPGALLAERKAMLFSDLIRSSILALLACLAGWARLRGRLPVLGFWAVVGGALLIDLYTIDRLFYAPMPRPEISRSTELPREITDPIRADGSPVRVLPLTLVVQGGQVGIDLAQGNDYGRQGIQSVSGYHAAGLRRMKDFITSGTWRNPAVWGMFDASWVTLETTGIRLSDEERQGLVGSMPQFEYVTFHPSRRGDLLLFQNPGNLGRAFMVPRARVIEDPLETLTYLRSPEFDPSREVVVPRAMDGLEPAVDSLWVGEADLMAWDDEEIRVQVRGQGGYLVVADAHHPDWTAEIEGSEVPILPANHVLRVVAVPPGEHEVRFRFHDASVTRARWLSATGKGVTSLLVLVGLWGVWRRRLPAPA